VHIELIAASSVAWRLPFAVALQEQLVRALGSGDDCVIGPACGGCAAQGGATVSSDLTVLLVDGGHLAECGQACGQARQRAPGCPVLAAGDEPVHGQLERLLAAGATDLLFLPVGDAELAARVHRALGHVPPALPRLRAAEAAGKEPRLIDPRLKHMVGRSPAFVELLTRLPTLAGCDAGVLILGETGTGKEVFAQALHYLSARSAKPWVHINCGAIPIELVESELFGHVKGAYTTAHVSRAGLVGEAEGGTLFLDDVDCLPLAAQAKLLRLLQEREFRPVGSSTLRHADIRVIAASNRDLAVEAQAGRFRKDLYYRLNVLSLTLPPLRQRRDDIAALATHFVQLYAQQLRRPVQALAPQALHKLMQHDWPGNVRELQHAIERAVLLAPGPVLDAGELEAGAPSGAEVDLESSTFQGAKARVVERFERDYIERALAHCNGNITQAARQAGKHRRAFFALIRKHGIELGAFRAPAPR
jgi:two-component system, NtrC family, response regulator GlrR